MLRCEYFWHRPGRSRRLPGRVSLILFFSLLFFLAFATPASAHSVTAPTSDANLQQLDVGPGFLTNPTARRGYWVPVFATVNNHDGRASFNGSLVVKTYNGYPRASGTNLLPSQQSFDISVTLSPGAEKRFTIYVPFNTGPFTPQGIMADLRDSHGKTLNTLTRDVSTANQNDFTIGVLSDHTFSFLNSPLNNLQLPNQGNTINVVPLNASTLPTQTMALEGFEAIIIDDFSTSTLSQEQFNTLQTWVNQGGTLIEVGGSDWRRTLSHLPSDLLPVDIDGTVDLPAGTHLLPASGYTPEQNPPEPSDTLSTPVTVSTATMRSPEKTGTAFTSTAVMASETVPMFIQTHQGQGNICYLAFDPASPSFANWPGLKALWTHILSRALSDQVLIPTQSQHYSAGPGTLLARGGIVSSLEPNVGIPLWIFVVLLLSYIALLGPIRLIFTRRAKRPFWNWRIVVTSIVVFSLVSYGAAFYQKGASLTDNSLSLIQLNQSGSGGHSTTYMGVFVPNQDNFKVHIPGVSLLQTISDPLFSSGSSVINDDSPTPVHYGTNTTDVSLLNAGMWTFHPLVYEQDRQFHGTVLTQLSLHGNKLTGTIKNTLPTALSDVYVLLPHSFVSLGNLAAGATLKVNQPLQSLLIGATSSLADQIAASNNLSTPYFPYTNHEQPQNTTQRHIAELAALNGTGNSFAGCTDSCSANAIVNTSKNSITAPPLGGLKLPLSSTSDPLLINGTSATLIAWADQPLDGTGEITVNGQTAHGYHDNLITKPLSLSLTAPFDLPPDFIAGKFVDAQGEDIGMPLPGVYTLAKGSASFEFSLPDTGDAGSSQIKSVTISIPNTSTAARPPVPDVNYLTARLYNWQNASLDQISLSHNALTVSNPDTYIGPDGRVLLQISNQTNNQGLIFFNRPSINLN